jgi:predicted nuclease of predicted toxin-antitoxin system
VEAKIVVVFDVNMPVLDSQLLPEAEIIHVNQLGLGNKKDKAILNNVLRQFSGFQFIFIVTRDGKFARHAGLNNKKPAIINFNLVIFSREHFREEFMGTNFWDLAHQPTRILREAFLFLWPHILKRNNLDSSHFLSA